MSELKRSGYYCPKCENFNECSCDACKQRPLLKKEVIITSDETMICAYCNNEFTYEDSLEIDYKINIFNEDIEKSLILFKDSFKEKLDSDSYKIFIDDLIIDIEDKCENEACKQSYLIKLQNAIQHCKKLELMIYYKSIIF